jgi:hypothetical protein
VVRQYRVGAGNRATMVAVRHGRSLWSNAGNTFAALPPRYLACMPLLSGHVLHRRRAALGSLLVIAAVLDLSAGVGLAYVAGFGAVRTVLGHVDWVWLLVGTASFGVSFAGYYYAYRGIYRVGDGVELTPAEFRAAVVAGFGGFFAHGGAALDQYVLEAGGAKEREAKIRVAVLAGLEHGILALGGCGAAIAVLAMGLRKPELDFSLPWAVIPVPGFLLAFWLAGRYRSRFSRRRRGWRAGLGVFLDSILLVRQMFAQPSRYWTTLGGMALFWAADIFAAWAAVAAFGFQMNAATFIVGFGTGLVFTRRTGPLAGAGILALVLPVTIWYCGAPLAVTVVGIFAYRVLSLWLSTPPSLYVLRGLRELGEKRTPEAPNLARDDQEPALRHR